MATMKKTYKNEEISVTWQPDLCIHSEKCFHGLSSVFDPNKRPWVNLDGAENDKIIDQVNVCPSGALSGKYNSQVEEKVEPISMGSIDIMPNGPILIKGELEVNYKGQTEIKNGKVTALCRCGASGNKPYCDGSHVNAGFVD